MQFGTGLKTVKYILIGIIIRYIFLFEKRIKFFPVLIKSKSKSLVRLELFGGSKWINFKYIGTGNLFSRKRTFEIYVKFIRSHSVQKFKTI